MDKNDEITKITLPATWAKEVNVYVIKGETITLVDAGDNIDGAWGIFKEKLNSNGFNVKDIKQIIITHPHEDHIGFINYFDHDITFIGHPESERWVNPTPLLIEQQDSFYKELFHQLGVPNQISNPYITFLNKSVLSSPKRSLDLKIEEGEEVPGLSEWKIIHTFGHSQGHISLFHSKNQTLIGGDILLPHFSPNPIIDPPFQIGCERSKPQIDLNESLRRLLEFPIQKVLPGHGVDITNPNELIHIRLNRQHERAMQVKDLLLGKPMTAFELSSLLFPKIYKAQFGFTLFETVGQLDYLQSLEFIKEEQKTNGSIYTLC